MPENVTETRGASLEIAFEGSPGSVRSFNYDNQFGLLLEDVPAEQALDIKAADPQAESAWVALREILLEMIQADCTGPEIYDHIATARCGIDPETWADGLGKSSETVERNAKHATRRLKAMYAED